MVDHSETNTAVASDGSISASAPKNWFSWFTRVGPAIVVAAVVLGPGSIVSASRVGCEYGLDLLWVVPFAGLLMIGMTMGSMMIGVCNQKTLCQSVADTFGRPAAWIVGGSLMIAITLFQASNNNAMLMAAGGFVGPSTLDDLSPLAKTSLLFLVNLLIIAIVVLGRHDLYRLVERMMAVLVGMMVVAFGLSMIASQPSISEIGMGLIPKLAAGGEASESGSTAAAVSWLSIGAMIATTFSVAGAFYQSYQVKEKGWTQADLRVGLVDSFVGIASLALITGMIFITAATALHGVIEPSELTDASMVAMSLEPMFGTWAKIVFSLGIFAGAASSFLVNALIGGVVFCDAIGLSSKMSSASVRTSTIVALLLGWLVASTVTITGINLVSFIVIAQALTVLCFPILAIVIVWQLQKLTVRVPIAIKVLCWIGLVVVIALSIRTLWGLLS
ncbi:NRAMP family divalent metal transporter [Novipirellula sp. SH528]|uniref:NRAMP family divalent metal transporter n=1 Tax=Novipirellula sp. SH528 TaxID=3454466 RepID=UPI003F9EFB68